MAANRPKPTGSSRLLTGHDHARLRPRQLRHSDSSNTRLHHDVVTRMSEITTIVAAEDDPASFVAPDLLLSFWRPFQGDDDPDDEQGYYFNSVLLARPGYYDGPGQP